VLQQSHHCGIETHHSESEHICSLGQQSHHCGIETHRSRTSLLATSRSNRTIVGLKLKFEVMDADLTTPAAIAPLWD